MRGTTRAERLRRARLALWERRARMRIAARCCKARYRWQVMWCNADGLPCGWATCRTAREAEASARHCAGIVVQIGGVTVEVCRWLFLRLRGFMT